ncbi:MAG: DUF2806 domain-containing protein, partial [Alphaproteobacteria bacterium]|nr:DUF2806 domain-containing protein [Alphaproteobacteria bacterium]
MDTLQPSDIPDGRGGFMLRDDAAKPRHSEAATLDAKLTEGDVGEALTENKSDEVAASEPVHPDVMQQQEWQDDASSPSGAVSDGVTTLSQNDTLDDHNNSASPDLSHDSDQTVVDNTHLNDQESRPPSAGERAASQTPSGADPSLDDDIHQDTPSDSDDKMPTAAAEGDHSSASHDQATEISATSEPDFAEDEISAPLAQDAGNQAGQFLHHPPSHQNTIPNRVSPTPSTDPSANALLGKISEMLGSLPKIDQHHPTQHPDNTSKHALATARVMFSPQLPAEASPVLSSTQRRGLQRLAHEEGLRQENIERIIAGSLGYLMPQATPDTIDKDWLSHFFDRARLAGDVETQAIWSRVLATKANNPNAQSRKTIA